MPVKHRPPMPKLPPFALANIAPPRKRPPYIVFFYFLFAAPLFAIHLQLLNLPYFWDEQGQFIPTALDLLRHGWWVARSTVPNVHPPGVEMYLALCYRAFGSSDLTSRGSSYRRRSICCGMAGGSPGPRSRTCIRRASRCTSRCVIGRSAIPI